MITYDKLIDGIVQLRLNTRCLHAADESGGNIANKFQQLGIEDSPENRIAYRGAMITTAGYGEVIGGVILFDETFRQTYEGKTVPDILNRQGSCWGQGGLWFATLRRLKDRAGRKK